MAAAITAIATACTGTSSTQVAVRAETTVPRRTTTTAPPDCAQMLPAEGKAAQLLMATVANPGRAQPLVAEGLVGGMVLSGEQSSQVSSQIASAIAEAPLAVTVAAAEEGGGTQQLRNSAGQLAAAATLGKGTPQDAATATGEHAAKVRAQGVTMVLAPVADSGSGGVLGTRTYGSDPALVGDMVAAVIPAVLDQGVLPVVSHWPGVGRGTADPARKLTTVAQIDTLRTRDLVPFDRAIAAGVPAVLVTHAVIPGLTGAKEPATLSRAAITDELRGRQGFQGLVMTDDLGSPAVTGLTTQAEAAELAVAAGADVAVVNGQDATREAHARLVDAIAARRLDPDQVTASVRRVLATKGITGQCLDEVARYSALRRDGSSTTTVDGSTPGPTTTTGSDGTIDPAEQSQTPGAGTIVRTGPPTTRGSGSGTGTGSGATTSSLPRTTTSLPRTTTTLPAVSTSAG